MATSRFVLDVNILLDFLLERDGYNEISKIIEYLVKNKNGYISASSVPIIYFMISKYRKELLSFLPKILNYFTIWKVPSYIDWNHPLAQRDIDDYLIHLTAKSLDAFIITRDLEFLSLSDRAISIEEFFRQIQKEEKDKRVSFLDLPSQNLAIFSEVEYKIDKIINSSRFICGKYVKEFEEKFANYLGVKFCIGVNSGTSALIVALMAIGLKPGDEVIIPVNTFIATAEAVSILGGKPVFVDIHPEYYTIDVTQIEDKITERTKAIIPVHLYGQCADMDPIMEIARKYNLWVIEDACQAPGAEYKGRKAGTIGHIGCFSFYPSKNLGSWGEGGACVTNDDELAEKMYRIRNHGGIEKYQHDLIGGNFRMEEFQGAVLSEKLRYLDKWNEKRRKAANMYRKYFKELETNGFLKLPREAPYNKHVYHLFVVQIKNREKLINFLRQNGVEVSIHYPSPLHLVQVYKHLNYFSEKFSVVEKLHNRVLSFPIHEFIDDNKILYVKHLLDSFYEVKNEQGI